MRVSGADDDNEQMTGAEMVIQALADQGVKHLFGYPGGAVLPIYDALFQQDKVRHILVRHEQGAVHAAEGYARSTGKVGCVLVTSGPGATNAVTGLTDAFCDSIPLVVHHRPGADASDRQRRVPGMRHRRHHPAVHQVQLPGEDASTTCRACCTRRSTSPPAAGRGRWWSTSRRTSSSPPAATPSPRSSSTRAISPKLKGDPDRIKAAVELMARAKRPLFYTGGGVVNSGPQASALLRELVRLTGFPITSTLMGLGAYPGLRSAVARHARHARHLGGQLGDARLRSDDLHRRALRRPHHRPARCLLAGLDARSMSTSIRPRSTRTSRSTCRSSATARHVLEDMVRLWRANAVQPDKKALADWWKQIDKWRGAQVARLPELQHHHQAAIRDPAALRADQGSRHLHHHRGRPAPDVGGAVLSASRSRTAG